jgi:hypothetical protein
MRVSDPSTPGEICFRVWKARRQRWQENGWHPRYNR